MPYKFTLSALNFVLDRDIRNSSDREFLKTQILKEDNYDIDKDIDLKELIYAHLDRVIERHGESWTPNDAWGIVLAAFRHNCTDYDDFLQYLCDRLGFTPSREIVDLIKNVYRIRTDKFYPDFFDVVRDVWRENQ